MPDFGSFWRSRKYHLDKMSIGDLFPIFLQYPSILTYLALLTAAIAGFFWIDRPRLGAVLAIVVASIHFPFAWYTVHRWLLQSRILFRFRLTSGLWKRIHFDHHQDPNDLRVLFGAAYTTLPPMFLFSAIAGLVCSSPGIGLVYLATMLAHTIWNEFCHCVMHLKVEPRFAYLRRIQRLHRIHHFKNENVYFGITNHLWDRVFGTFPADPALVSASETVNNLGYDGDAKRRYPWVDRLASAEESAAHG